MTYNVGAKDPLVKLNYSSIREKKTVDSNINDVSETLLRIEQVLKCLKPRLDAFVSIRKLWGKGVSIAAQSVSSKDEKPLHPINALDPSPVVNKALSILISQVCLQTYEPYETIRILTQLDSVKVEQLREISTLSEQCLEKSALNLIFKLCEEKGKTLDSDLEIVAQKIVFEKDIDICLARFQALVVDLPKALKSEQPTLPYEPFVYFDNYVSIVDAELQLLTKDIPCLGKPILSEGEIATKQFTFVGAGFPLTAITLHIRTKAMITLIDCDREAVQNAKKLLKICGELRIIEYNSFSVIHADAKDCRFVASNSDVAQSVADTKSTVITDILDLASALPADVTAHVLHSCIEGNIPVRKRNVTDQHVTTLLYDRYTHNEFRSAYRVAAQVVPPHYPETEKNASITLGFMAENNVNSCQLLVPKSMLEQS